MTETKFKSIMLILIRSIPLYLFLCLFGSTVFYFCGLKYKSIGAIVRFVAIYMIITLPIDIIFNIFFKIIKFAKDLSTLQYNLLCYFVEIPINMFIIGVLEYFTKDVSCSMLTAFLFCTICFSTNLYVDLKAENSKQKAV